MRPYIDAFVLPVPRDRLDAYREVVEEVARIWKEHGALEYAEYVSDDVGMAGTRSFGELAGSTEDEVVIYGWVAFESRELRDLVNERVASDTRMSDLVAPLLDSRRMIFDASRMAYGGFRALVRSPAHDADPNQRHDS